MMMLKAIVRPNRVDAVKEALEMSGVTLLPKMEIETVVPDDAADEAIKAVATAARTGEIGDGRIFVLPVVGSYKIRTGEMTS